MTTRNVSLSSLTSAKIYHGNARMVENRFLIIGAPAIFAFRLQQRGRALPLAGADFELRATCGLRLDSLHNPTQIVVDEERDVVIIRILPKDTERLDAGFYSYEVTGDVRNLPGDRPILGGTLILVPKPVGGRG